MAFGLTVTEMFDIAQARHEIEKRNRIRGEAKLPPVSVVAELRRLYEVQRKRDFERRENEFEQFLQTSPIRKRLEQKLLERGRRLRGEPDWKPNGMLSGGGWAFYVRTRKIMRRIWWMQRQRVGRLDSV
jgi:hypothetical protein